MADAVQELPSVLDGVLFSIAPPPGKRRDWSRRFDWSRKESRKGRSA